VILSALKSALLDELFIVGRAWNESVFAVFAAVEELAGYA
jgi:hypothetical protein